MSCWVCFRDAVPKAKRSAIENAVPEVVRGWFKWRDRVLEVGNDDDSLQWSVRAAYEHVVDEDEDFEPDPEMPSTAMWKQLNADIDAWLLSIHAAHPIEIVVKPIDEEYSTETDAWHDWSCERIPTAVLPKVEEVDVEVARYIAEMWKAWVQEKSFDEQLAVVAALGPAERKALKKYKALFVPKEPPPAPKQPSLDEADVIWRRLAAAMPPSPKALRLEDAFDVAMIERQYEYSLNEHASKLLTAKRDEDFIALSRAVLESGAEFPTNWMPGVASLLIEQGRLDEAKPIIHDIVASLESYKPEMLATVMRYHSARGEHDIAAMLYHAGMSWFTSFTYEVPKSQTQQYGKRPTELAQDFARWLESWVGTTAWNVSLQPRLGHWLVWFDAVGKDAFAPQVAAFEAERDRRLALWAQLEAATDETTARTLVDQLAPIADAEQAARIAGALHEKAPLAVFALLDRALANERREGYRYPTGGRVNAIIFLTYLALNHPALADELSCAYQIARGYVLVKNQSLHYNLACVACRLGKRTEAIGHVARALELGFENPQQIHDDNDLEPLRGDPVFEGLFVTRTTPETATRKPTGKKRTARKPAVKKAAKAAKKAPAKPVKSKSAQKKKPAKRRK